MHHPFIAVLSAIEPDLDGEENKGPWKELEGWQQVGEAVDAVVVNLGKERDGHGGVKVRRCESSSHRSFNRMDAKPTSSYGRGDGQMWTDVGRCGRGFCDVDGLLVSAISIWLVSIQNIHIAITGTWTKIVKNTLFGNPVRVPPRNLPPT